MTTSIKFLISILTVLTFTGITIAAGLNNNGNAFALGATITILTFSVAILSRK